MKLIILDRDGVINHDSEHYIKSPEEWKPIPGSMEAIARLTHEGYRIVVATNQSGVGRGLFDMDTLNAIHEKMIRSIKESGGHIDSIFYCPHASDAHCECRKPKPGMLLQISERYNKELDDVFVIGDSLRDLIAAEDAGALPILVLTGKGKKTHADNQLPEGTLVFDDLAAATDFILQP